ncbi:MAG: TolB family protein [bacterium]
MSAATFLLCLVGCERALAAEPPIRPLTETPEIAERQPAWSPSGEWIVYSAGDAATGDLWLMTPDGTERRQITHDDAVEYCPAWSPDGTRIAYSGTRGEGAPAIWILDLRDSSIVRLTNERGRVHEPAWSPDGETIAYYGIASGDEQVWSIPAGGGEPRRLSHHVTQSWSAAWSPDGAELVYAGYRNARTGGSLFIMPRDGEGDACEHARALTTRRDHRWDRFPDWSRDGQWIVFAGQTTSGGLDLWLVSADRAIEERLTEHPAEDTEPSWSPDGESVVFVSERAGSPDLWILDAATAAEPYHSREAPKKK